MLLPKQSVSVDRFKDSPEPVRTWADSGILPSPQACCCAPGLGPPACAFDEETCMSQFGGWPCPGQCGGWC
jgi:hypothetical protein